MRQRPRGHHGGEMFARATDPSPEAVIDVTSEVAGPHAGPADAGPGYLRSGSADLDLPLEGALATVVVSNREGHHVLAVAGVLVVGADRAGPTLLRDDPL